LVILLIVFFTSERQEMRYAYFGETYFIGICAAVDSDCAIAAGDAFDGAQATSARHAKPCHELLHATARLFFAVNRGRYSVVADHLSLFVHRRLDEAI